MQDAAGRRTGAPDDRISFPVWEAAAEPAPVA